jgi:hypothetical protein
MPDPFYYIKPHIIHGVVKDAAKAAGKGIGAAGVGFGKSQAGLPRDMCN